MVKKFVILRNSCVVLSCWVDRAWSWVGMKKSCMWDPITMREGLTSRTLPSLRGPYMLRCYMPQHLPTHIPPLTRLLHSHCYILLWRPHTPHFYPHSVQNHTNFLTAESMHTHLNAQYFTACSFLVWASPSVHSHFITFLLHFLITSLLHQSIT